MTIELDSDHVALCTWPVKEKKLLTWRKTNILAPEQHLIALRDERGAVEAVEPDEKGRVDAGSRELILVPRRAFEFTFEFPAVKRDDENNAWDMTLRGEYRVQCHVSFIEGLGRGALAPNSHLPTSTLTGIVLGRLQDHILDALYERPLSALRDRSLTPRWWELNLNEWAASFGLGFNVTQDPAWTSSQADAARMEQERREARDNRLKLQQEEQDAQLALEKSKRDHELRMQHLQHDKSLDQTKRNQQLEYEHLKHQTELAELGTRSQEAAWKQERAALEHQARVAELQGRSAGAAKLEAMVADLAERNERAQATNEGLIAMLTEIQALPQGALGGNLGAKDPQQAFLAADRLLSPEYGLTVGQLHALGVDTTLHDFIAMIHEASAADSGVALSLPSLVNQTRDVALRSTRRGTPSQVEIPTLRIGDSLRMGLRAGRAGFVTVINFGTSGKVWCNVPNAFCGVEQTYLEQGAEVLLPGSVLLPFEPFDAAGYDDLQEAGPVGREHMLVIISDQPIGEGLVLDERSDQPFRQLSTANVKGLYDELISLGDETWSAAELSFDVLPA